jgi:leucyl/phenylalanyl-tRNA--protein transferase
LSVEQAVALYAAGWFPMDDAPAGGDLPWYATEQRAILPLGEEERAAVARRVRRDLRACAGFEVRLDAAYDRVLDLCSVPPDPADGIWISERLKDLYRRLHAAGWSHSFELWTPEGELAAGILGVVIGRAAILESMRMVLPGAGNALLSRTLDLLAARGMALCDIQLTTDHTRRLGAQLVERDAFDAALAAAVREA